MEINPLDQEFEISGLSSLPLTPEPRPLIPDPDAGSIKELLTLALPFILTMIGAGLWISVKADTTDAAGQLVMGTVMPSIFLSGYVFPVDSMPPFFGWLSHALPTTWLIDASRGVILRGAGWRELWPHALVLWAMAILPLVYSTLKFKKRLSA